MDLPRLRLKRGQIKASVTLLEKWVDQKAQEAGGVDIEVRLKRLQKYEEQFEKVQSQVEAAVEVDDFDAEQTERLEFDERLTVLEAALMELKHSFDTSVALNDTHGGNISLDLVTSDLPQIDLPKFSGEYLEYPQFIDTFNALVHNVKSRGMTDIRRFGLLKSSLKGKALESIANIPMVAGNYPVALEILKERFYKQRLIFTSYVRRLWEVQKATNTVSLRQLCDTYSSLMKGLELIATPQQVACGIVIQLMLTKCDPKTMEEWEKVSATKDTLPTDSEFHEFLRKRCTQLEGVDYALRTASKAPQQLSPASQNRSKTRHANTSSTSHQKSQCPLCNGPHALVKCDQFLKATSKERYELVKKMDHCVRCLQHNKGHRGCKQKCDTCSRLHHILLHFDTPKDESSPESSSAKPPVTSSSNIAHVSMGNAGTVVSHANSSGVTQVPDPSCDMYTFLATAIAEFKTIDGNYVTLRILFDGGNQVNMISERARHLLGLAVSTTKYEIELTGINNSTVTLRKRVVVDMKSLSSDFKDTIVLMVHPRLKQTHPSQSFDVSAWNLPKDIQLADPHFYKSQDVDIVLSSHKVDCYTSAGNIPLGDNLPRLRETKLGWIVLGNLSLNMNSPPSVFTCAAFDNVPSVSHEPSLSHQLQKFWELESIVPSKSYSDSEEEIEKHFKTTHKRMPDGRFIVRLPFSRSPEILGKSKAIALKRLATIERKCRMDNSYGQQYTEFIDEYIQLGHCQEVTHPTSQAPHYYIPHFAVTNENSTTTRTRVVFDASCHTDSGISLNETLMVGPKLQDDLVIHLVRFRLKKYVVTGDVSKMYRQILVHPDDRRYQYILWKRPNETAPHVYELNTVTYGTACAPFLAVRCMQELALQDGSDLPIGQRVLCNNFYVDDMLAGADSLNEAYEIYEQVSTILKRGQMTIRKFQSNAPELLKKIPESDHGTYLQIGDTDVIKTLGLNWIPETDHFKYYYEISENVKLTRRSILSEILRLFDPLGLVQPVIVRAKIFMQRLYDNTTNWDDPLSPEDCQLWQQYREELKCIDQISVPRLVVDLQSYTKQDLKFELYGFCDASQKAYAACLYVRTLYPSGEARMNLLIAKTRVAPLKVVSLPRLELCSALLLTELYERMSPVLELDFEQKFLYTDSTITLRWISESPHKWTPFVATRVTKIQLATKDCEWRHIGGTSNPADMASRGGPPKDLANCDLWFHGPLFIRKQGPWPPSHLPQEDVPEVRKVATTLVATRNVDLVMQCKLMSFVPLIKHAVWPKIRRIFAYVAKFIHCARQKAKEKRELGNRTLQSANLIELDVSDITQGTLLIIRIVQHEHFHDEIKLLKSERQVSGMLHKLSVFYDPKSLVVRVGGRLHAAPELPFSEKHPCLLPPNHAVTKLLFMWYHNEKLHAGPTALLAFVREEFWPLNGKVIANQTVHSCIRCSRAKPVTLKQIMGELPEDRTTFSRPFQVCAVDFAGPFMVHYRLRGSRPTKAYLAIFVCFSSKAVHLELVEDLTVDAFLNCLQRFVNRRKAPERIWSDNATNFVAASRKLAEFKKFYFDESTQKGISTWCRDHKMITWSFIPPRSPHFNGLVEAAVKSAKYHLMRLSHIDTLTFPELNTVVIMVEGILNARPLTPLSCSPNDGQPLTPAHLLLGGPLIGTPEPELTITDADVPYKWRRTVAIKQEFWRKWSKEYLKTLQIKHKWTSETPNPQLNDLVLLVDRDIAPLKWRIGKICKLYPGRDNKIRVVDVETATGTYCRSITELCPIPRKKPLDSEPASVSSGPGC